MKVKIELRSGSDIINIEPASCVITRAVCNESLQHVENTCEVKFIYESELFAFIVSHEQMEAVVRSPDGAVLFTGTAGADTSWTDIGEPHPIESFALTIRDYTSKLDILTGSEIAFLNAPLTAVLQRLVGDCGLAMLAGQVPQITIEAFVLPPDRNYRQALDALCYQYQLSFYFDNTGRVNFFYFGNIPSAVEPLGESAMLAGVKVKKSRKQYDAVQIEYSTLTTKPNEQIYFESFGYASDNTPSPVIIQPGVYYPFDSAPEIESTEGQVYQSFTSGYAESRKKYNGELEYRRSKDTSLLYTSRHSVVQDWEGSLAINRTGFESLRSSVRLRNTGSADAKLRQFAIRADAIYRNKAVTVTAGSGSKDRTFSSSTEFVYNIASAENLAKSLYRYFSRASLIIEFSTDMRLIQTGSYHSIDTGKSGLTVDALVLSYSLDCEKDIYSYKAVSVGPAAVNIFRIKNIESDPFKGEPGKDGQYTDYRFAKNTSVNIAPNYTANADNPGSNWTDTPPALSTSEYLWMVQADWRGSEKLTAWSTPVRLSGPVGAPGAAGKGISSINYKFKVTNSATTPTQAWNDSSWLTAMPATTESNRWLWFIERITFSDNTTQDTIGLQAVHGQTGATGAAGNYHELRYIRAAVRPATPTGDSPANWTTDPSSHAGSDPLWMTRGIKNASGVLQGAWSLPVQISGENGLGIDAVPDDPWGYWSCDDPIDRIEERVWSTHQSNFTQGIDGWIANHGNLSVTGGGLRFAMTGDNPYIYRRINYNSGVIYFRLSGDFNMEYCSLWRSNNTYITAKAKPATNEIRLYYLPDGYFAILVPNDNFDRFRIDPHAGSNAIGLTVYLEFLYISPIPYMGFLSDNSGNGRHMTLEPGVAQNPTDRGKGLQFSGIGAAYTKDTFYPTGDITWSLWVNKYKTAAVQSLIANVENGGCQLSVISSGDIRLAAYSGGAYRYAAIPLSSVPDNMWLHIILKYNSETKTFKFKINNVLDSVTLTLPAQISWPAAENGVPLMLGANPGPFQASGISGSSDFFYGQLDEVAVFTRLTTDREDEALYKTTLEKKFTSAITSWDERYMGATDSPDLTNSGVVNGRRMNPGNYVMYKGTQQGTGANIWRAAFLYQWLGTRWVELSREQNYDKYINGISDLTSGAHEGVFSTVFIEAIVAQKAFIEELQSKVIKLFDPTNNNNYIELSGEKGKMQSSNFVNTPQERSGFNIQSNDGSVVIDKMDTWIMKTRPAMLSDFQYINRGRLPWGLDSFPMRGGLRAMVQFWKDSSGFDWYGHTVDYDDLGRSITVAKVLDTTTNGVFKLEYNCKTATEAEIMKRGRIFGYYTRGRTPLADGTYIPNNWGVIVQDHPGESIPGSVVINGLKVTYTFVCMNTGQGNTQQSLENPEWYGTLLLFA